jgi:restriction system protein
MQLPPGFDTAARVAYSSASHQVMVEFELPIDTVIPKAKSYRWVESREVVEGTPHPAAQVNSLYAGVIAH